MEPGSTAFPDGPPADPEEWTHEQWIAWLKETDEADPDAQVDAGPVTRAGRVTRSTGGQMLGQAMLGMASALYGRTDDDVVIVAAGDSEPEGEGEVYTVNLDPDHPERSTVVFRVDPDTNKQA